MKGLFFPLGLYFFPTMQHVWVTCFYYDKSDKFSGDIVIHTLFVCRICAPGLFSSVMVPLFGNFFTTGTNEKTKGLGGKPIETWDNKEMVESANCVLLLSLLTHIQKIIFVFEESLFKLKPQDHVGNTASSLSWSPPLQNTGWQGKARANDTSLHSQRAGGQFSNLQFKASICMWIMSPQSLTLTRMACVSAVHYLWLALICSPKFSVVSITRSM